MHYFAAIFIMGQLVRIEYTTERAAVNEQERVEYIVGYPARTIVTHD